MNLGETDHACDVMSEEINEKEVKECNFALVYIVMAVSQNCTAPVQKISFPAEVRTKLNTMFQAVFKAVLDA